MSNPHSPSIGAVTDPGQVRELNEDSIGTPERMEIPAERRATRGWLLAVADGMGGHAAGEVASELAIKTLYEQYYGDPSPDLAASLEQAVAQANARIHAEAAADLRKHGMGTTLVAAVFHGGRLIVANVGDSRAYLVRGNHIRQISRDHSWVAESVAAGLISEEQARHHPQRHLVMRVLGQKPDVQVDIFERPLRPGDTIVLCSDGLSNEVSDAEIAQYAGHRPTPSGAQMLLDLANARPARDNISVVVARLPAERRRRAVSPLVALAVGALLVLAVLAVLILQPWRWGAATPTPSGPAPMVAAQQPTHAPSATFLLPPTVTVAASLVPAFTPAATVVAPSATPDAPSATPSPRPSLTASPLPSPTSTLAASPSLASLAVERSLGISDATVLLPLAWGCSRVSTCHTVEHALAGLGEILGSAAEGCDLEGKDREAALDFGGTEVQCPLSDETLVCLQGTALESWMLQPVMRLGGWFDLMTEDGDTWHVMQDVSRSGWLSKPLTRQQVAVPQVTACGISLDGRLLWAPLIAVRRASGSEWLSEPLPDERYWLAGEPEVLEALPVPPYGGLAGPQRVSPGVFGTEPVLVYSQWEGLRQGRRSGFQPVFVEGSEPAIFPWYEPNQRFEHFSERGQ